MKPARRVALFGMQIDSLGLSDATEQILQWCGEPAHSACRYVVTPNVDHAVLYQRRADMRESYRGASLVLADGAPVVWASRLLGRSLPGRVAGSDLAPAVLEQAARWAALQNRSLRVFLLGAGPGVADRAKIAIHRKYDGVEVVGTLAPPIGFEIDDRQNQRILASISDARPDIVLIGLGAPKQELWACRFAERIDARVALCVGATIDFMAGERRRAPKWMQRTGTEWLHRLASEPKRLAARYLKDAAVFPQLVWREWRGC